MRERFSRRACASEPKCTNEKCIKIGCRFASRTCSRVSIGVECRVFVEEIRACLREKGNEGKNFGVGVFTVAIPNDCVVSLDRRRNVDVIMSLFFGGVRFVELFFRIGRYSRIFLLSFTSGLRAKFTYARRDGVDSRMDGCT